MLLWVTGVATIMWLALLVLPWRPYATREELRAEPPALDTTTSDITALIPARDEARCIARTLAALAAQGRLAQIVLVDDQSSDDTAAVAQACGLENLIIVRGTSPPAGWSGKLWALHQGLVLCESRYTLLLDADIELAPGMLSALRGKLIDDDRALVSVMATLHMHSAWEKMLLPAFVYFFKLLYPFALSNEPRSKVAAAAGGCVLVETSALRAIGGFEALHDAIIDDCTLARLIKSSGGRTWIGLTHDARAIRPYASLAEIWDMVARTAYTQLRYSPALLLLCTVLLLISFVAPAVALSSSNSATQFTGLAALACMGASYRPTIRYYRLYGGWILTLPLTATLFLAMTWTSACRYWGGERSRWKSRSYDAAGAAPGTNIADNNR